MYRIGIMVVPHRIRQPFIQQQPLQSLADWSIYICGSRRVTRSVTGDEREGKQLSKPGTMKTPKTIICQHAMQDYHGHLSNQESYRNTPHRTHPFYSLAAFHAASNLKQSDPRETSSGRGCGRGRSPSTSLIPVSSIIVVLSDGLEEFLGDTGF